ncbi:MAG: hypothetical protein ACRCU1_03545, partial [Alsobacter sp.]
LRSASDREMGAGTYEENDNMDQTETAANSNENPIPEAPVSEPSSAVTLVTDSPTEMVQYAEAPKHVVQAVLSGSDDWALALEPQSTESAWKLAGAFFNSRMFKGFSSREAVFSAIMLGRTLGLPAATVVRGCHVIEGKLSMSAQLIVGLVMKSGKADFFKCSERTPTKCTWKTHRKGDPDDAPVTVTWTIEDAKRAGLVRAGGNYEKYPAQMLSARASVDLARMVFPDIASNLYTPEELGDAA